MADADIVICSSDAQFFDPHVSIGQVVSIEAIGLMRKMPVEAVMRMAFVGRHERMSAQRAYELGMVSEVVDPPDRLRERAQELAETIARNSPAAAKVPAVPSTSPATGAAIPCRTTNRITSPGCEPSANRIPISRVRRPTAYATTA